MLIMCVIPIITFAQRDNYVYLFDDFLSGQAVTKQNSVSRSKFNYDISTGKVHFLENGEVMILSDPDGIASVTIGEHHFINIGNGRFYEKINLEKINLFIDWKGAQVSQGSNTGYGKSQTTSSVYTDKYYSKTDVRSNDLSITIDYMTLLNNNYYLKFENKYKRFNSLKSLAKLFNGHEKEIMEGLKNENLNFKEVPDVVKAVKYCSQFLQ